MYNYLAVKDTIFKSNITLNCKGKLIEFDTPIIMGIVNTTPDSFYKGSRNKSIEDALEITKQFVKQEVDIIDVGGYSSRPGAQEINELEELNRVIPVIKAIKHHFPDLIISIDTFRPKVARLALIEDADIINDISGGQFDTSIFKVASEFSAPYIMMHMRGTPKNMQSKTQYKHLIKTLILFFSKQIKMAQNFGVKDIIVDPGLGFSKTLEQNYDIIKHLDLFNVLDKPILVGASRKSMLYKFLDITPDESLNATSIINTIALTNGAHILRVHDVREAMELKKIFTFLNRTIE